MAGSNGSKYDVIVIGGGHNGLVNAAYLARAGKKILVLERRYVLGGAACTEEIVPGFKFSVCSYVVSLLRPEIIRDLDLPRHGLEILPLERGARLLATIGPFADELLVFPSTVLRNSPEDKQYSFACAIANDTPGLATWPASRSTTAGPGTITRSAPGSRKPMPSSSSMTCTFPTSAVSSSVTPNYATASTHTPRPWCT